jgi:hypothetical protein
MYPERLPVHHLQPPQQPESDHAVLQQLAITDATPNAVAVLCDQSTIDRRESSVRFKLYPHPSQDKYRQTATGSLCLPFNISIWMALSLGLLLLSNVLFFVAFVTQSWGTVDISTASLTQSISGVRSTVDSGPSKKQIVTWSFGLWRCCRDDGLCLGARWPGELQLAHWSSMHLY